MPFWNAAWQRTSGPTARCLAVSYFTCRVIAKLITVQPTDVSEQAARMTFATGPPSAFFRITIFRILDVGLCLKVQCGLKLN